MRITTEAMDKELRFRGVLLRKLFNLRSERMLRLSQWGVRRLFVGRNIRGLQCGERYIEDGRLRLRIYSRDAGGESVPGMLWIHGGGYAIGAPEMDAMYIKKMLDAADCVIVSPDYTLSLEKPYPAALMDCYAALLWMKENARALSVRDDQLFIGGESAGGGLAAATALYARDQGEVALAFQMPFYPMLDDRMITPSSRDNDAPIWNSRSNAAAWRLYLGDLFGSSEVPPYAAPSRAEDLRGLPPAYSFVGDIEPFFDETVEYFARLREAGGEAALDVYSGAFHAFDEVHPRAKISRRAAEEWVRRFQYAAEHYFAAQKTTGESR